MFKNYFKITFRNFKKDRLYSLVNIFGLSIGLTAFIVVAILVQYEISFDNFHLNGDKIYRIIAERKAPDGINIDAVTPPPLANALKNNFPEISNSVRFLKIDNPVPLVSSGNNRFYENQFSFVDASVFEIFTIPFAAGNPQTALKEPNSVVITERIAEKYFGSENPSGKILRLNNSIDLHVTGVIKNFPVNSTIDTDFLVSFSTLYGWLGKGFVDNWQNNMCQTYVLVDRVTSKEIIEKKLPDFISRHIDKSNPLKQLHLQSMNRIHLYSNADFGLNSDGDIGNIYLISALGVFILLIACFNYISLTVTRFTQRSKETGVRKLLGATRKQLIYQFFGESFFFTTAALMIALLISAFVLPNINNLFGINFSFDFAHHLGLVVFPIVLILITGLLSGSYPALIISSFKPVNTVNMQSKGGTGKTAFGKIVITAQFVLTNILIIGSLVVYNQLSFMQNKKLGFAGEQVIVIPMRDEGLRQSHEALKTRLLQFNGIKNVGAAALLPGGPVGKTRFLVHGISKTGIMPMLWVDTDFIETLGLKISAGRDFSKNYSTDASEAFIINEEAVKKLGFKNPADAIDKSFELVGSKKGNIVGVVKNFHFSSLQNKIDPIVLHIWPWINYLLVRIDVDHMPKVIEEIKNIWNDVDPNNPFEYNFLNDNFSRFYEKEQQLERVSACFTSVALIIALIGLFGLSAYTTERRTKEIGIRKVLGATIPGIIVNQLKEFGLPVVIAIIIAFPVGYFIMSQWLHDYAYRVEISTNILLLAGLITITTALLTVCYHSVKASLINPVESIKYE